jgi:hypothetical protein
VRLLSAFVGPESCKAALKNDVDSDPPPFSTTRVFFASSGKSACIIPDAAAFNAASPTLRALYSSFLIFAVIDTIENISAPCDADIQLFTKAVESQFATSFTQQAVDASKDPQMAAMKPEDVVSRMNALLATSRWTSIVHPRKAIVVDMRDSPTLVALKGLQERHADLAAKAFVVVVVNASLQGNEHPIAVLDGLAATLLPGGARALLPPKKNVGLVKHPTKKAVRR